MTVRLIKYIEVASNGKILAFSEGMYEEVEEAPVLYNGTLIEVQGNLNIDPTQLYWDFDNEELAVIPAKSASYLEFDFDSKEWVDNRALNDVKASRWAYIKRKRALAEKQPFTFNDNIYDADPIRIPGVVVMATLANINQVPFETVWTTKDNQEVTLNNTTAIQFGLAYGQRIQDVFAIGRELRADINAATTIEEINYIDWPN
jgi:hypothetical protein